MPAAPAAEAGAPLSLGRHDPTLRSEECGGATERGVGEDGPSPKGGGDVGLLGPAQRWGVHGAQGSWGGSEEVNNLDAGDAKMLFAGSQRPPRKTPPSSRADRSL